MAVVAGLFGKSVKSPNFGFFGNKKKLFLAAILGFGISLIAIWLTFSFPSSAVYSPRRSFGWIKSNVSQHRDEGGRSPPPPPPPHVSSTIDATDSEEEEEKERIEINEDSLGGPESGKEEGGSVGIEEKRPEASAASEPEGLEMGGDEEEEVEEKEGIEGEEGDNEENRVEEEKKKKKKKKKDLGHLFETNGHQNWKLCSGTSVQNFIPCIDLEGNGSGKLRKHRHHERSCPDAAPMCLIPLPKGYESPIPWPESNDKVFYRNVAHPKLSAFLKTQTWLKLDENFLTFPRNESVFKGGAPHYLESITELVPDIDWGKNIRLVLDIGCTDASFEFALLEKDVLTLSLGLMNDETDLAQVCLERGFPAVLANLGSKKLPIPYGVFDAIHCGECNIPWHSNGGMILLEMNRMLRPGGYFLISFRHGDIEDEEAMSQLTRSISWNTMAHKTDDETDLNVKIYQRPSSNDEYELRRMKGPPLCNTDETQDSVWYTPIEKCLHKIPASIEQRGTEWPEEWPNRLETFPDWLEDSHEKLTADTKHWKSIINKSYLNRLGIDWTHVRNVMDMRAIYGGFAAALSSQKVWVMNVVPVNASNTLPVIFERGLIGVYHDWCQSFSTYPRSYDLLHADHLFSRLKNWCKQPFSIVVEMDRVLRPGGWAIIRDKSAILESLEVILRTLHWDIKMTFFHNKQGVMCAQKTPWRPS